jgi:hypothetical protein
MLSIGTNNGILVLPSIRRHLIHGNTRQDELAPDWVIIKP